MASLAYTAPPLRAPHWGWRRLRRRRWVRPAHLPSPESMLSAIPSLPRSTLAQLTQRMIDRMDEIDGDPDLEQFDEDNEDGHDRESVYD